MTKNELDTFRKRAPWAIFTIGVSLYFVVISKDLETAKLRNEVIAPFIAFIATFFYIGLGVRGYLWKREMDAHVGKQIRAALIGMVPEDLQVTAEEKEALSAREVFKNLTGVFWEAVDGDDILSSHKEHFYSNGSVYSTSIDVFIIGFIFASVDVAAALLTGKSELLILGLWCGVIGAASRMLVTRSSRKRHLSLSSEQLELLKRRQGTFVVERFREIVLGWRADRERS